MAQIKRLAGLWALLGIQILAAIWLWWPHQTGRVTGQPWLIFSPQKVTRIALTSGAKTKPHTLTLEKQSGKWRLPNADDFPADTSKVKQLLDTLAGLKGTLPVAVTHDAAKRFRVAKDKFATRMTLAAGNKQLATLYAGNAAGANLVYLRRADSNEIEAHSLSSWLLSAETSNWRDQDLLHITAGGVDKVVLPNLTLVKQKAGWKASGSPSSLDNSKVKTLVQKLAQLDYVKVLGKKAGHPLHTTFKVAVDAKGKTLNYDFAKVQVPGKPTDKDDQNGKAKTPNVTWKLTRSGLPYVFTVSGDTATALQTASVKSLAKPPAAKQAKAKGKVSAGKNSKKATAG